MTTPLKCYCCLRDVEPRPDDPWQGRLDGYCEACATARCDAYPGDCGQTRSTRSPYEPTPAEKAANYYERHSRWQEAWNAYQKARGRGGSTTTTPASKDRRVDAHKKEGLRIFDG